MSLQYQDRTIQNFHLSQKYAENVISYNLLRGDVTTNILLQMILRR